MADKFKREWFDCLTDFSYLNGRKKQWVIVGDGPDARVARFWFRSQVSHNWPSQWHTKYKSGYIEFENGKKFDLAIQAIRGNNAFIFEDSNEVYILYYRQSLEEKIKRSLNVTAPREKLQAVLQIRESIVAALPNRPFGLHQVLGLLPALSASQLENLVERIAAAVGGQTGAPSSAAA